MDTSTAVASSSGTNNVLYEPEIYRPQEEEEEEVIDEQMVETQSISTIGGQESIVSNYKTDLDPSIFAAHKM